MAEAALVQQAYTNVLKHFVRTGRAPHYTELAVTMGLAPDEARDLQREAAQAGVGCWFATLAALRHPLHAEIVGLLGDLRARLAPAQV